MLNRAKPHIAGSGRDSYRLIGSGEVPRDSQVPEVILIDLAENGFDAEHLLRHVHLLEHLDGQLDILMRSDEDQPGGPAQGLNLPAGASARATRAAGPSQAA